MRRRDYEDLRSRAGLSGNPLVLYGMPADETGAVIFQSQGAEDHPISLDLLIMSDGTWQPDGFDSDREGTAADVRGYLSQWTGDNR